MLKIVVKLVSSYRHHGSAGPKPTKIRSTAASKLSALLNKEKQPESGSSNFVLSDQENDQRKERKQPKEYGSHQGNLQVKILKEIEITSDNQSQITNYITNLTSNFESRNSWDLRTAKHNYKTFKDEVLKEYADKYGNQLSETVTTNLLKKLASKAFVYTSHQIVITLESDKQIEGSRISEDGHFYLTIKSKMIYSSGKQLFNSAEIKALMETPDDEVKLKVTTITRVPAILTWNVQKQCYIVTYQGLGNILAQDSYA